MPFNFCIYVLLDLRLKPSKKPLETRLKWEEWPWADWWRFNIKMKAGPRLEHGEYDVHDTHNPMLTRADICPDCCRVSLVILCALGYWNQVRLTISRIAENSNGT